MSNFFRGLAFLVAVCCLTWLGVLWWWQRSGHPVQVVDMVVYLGLLPLVLALLLLALRWAWRSAVARQGAAAAAAASGAEGAAAGAAVPADEEQERYRTVQLVQVAAWGNAGSAASDFLDAAEQGKPAPAPTAELTDEQGLPVMCARVPDKQMPLDALRAALEDLLPLVRQQRPEWQALEPDEHVVRALAALTEPLQTQRDWLHNLALLLQDQREPMPRGQPPALPSLLLLLGLPASWNAFEQALAQAWAAQALQAPEGDLQQAYAISSRVVAGSGESLWQQADQLAMQIGQGLQVDWLLVAACHSDVAQGRVDALVAEQSLFDAQTRAWGRMPGEAAAALLLAAEEWSPPEGLELKPVRLHRPALARRGKSVEARGRIDHQELLQAVEQALVAAKLKAEQLTTLVCDADQHSPRATELYGVTIAALPELDPVEDMRLLGKVTGHVGTASLLLVLAAAHDWVVAKGKPGLALGMADPFARVALVLQPGADPDATSA